MSSFSPIQRKMLANLEEAGEESLTALLNVVTTHRRSPEDAHSYQEALGDLLSRDLVELARSRDAQTRHWVPLPKSEAVAIVAQLGRLIRWSAPDQLWKWTAEEPRIQILTTDAGMAAVLAVLSEDGWPD